MRYNFDQIHDRENTGAMKWDIGFHNDSVEWIAKNPDLSPDQPLPMGLADMDFKTPQPVIDALVQRVQHGIFGYTAPADAYFDSIISWMARRRGWPVKREWIVTNPGVMQSINLAVQTCTKAGEGIIVQPPVFGPIPDAVENNGRIVLPNPLRYEDGRYEMDFDDLERKAAGAGAKMLILCSPHNPVGRVWNYEELSRLADICRRHCILILSDEVHADLIYPWAAFNSMGAIDPRLDERLIICTSASKTFNLPGMRTSLTIIPDAALRQNYLIAMRNNNDLFGVNTLGTLALQTAFSEGEEWLEQLLGYLEGNLRFLQFSVERTMPQLRVVKPEALFLVWIDCSRLGMDTTRLTNLFHQEAKVYPALGHVFGAGGEGFVRLNIACPRLLLAAALERISNAIERAGQGC